MSLVVCTDLSCAVLQLCFDLVAWGVFPWARLPVDSILSRIFSSPVLNMNDRYCINDLHSSTCSVVLFIQNPFYQVQVMFCQPFLRHGPVSSKTMFSWTCLQGVGDKYEEIK